jgi:hypothetical protein
MSLGRYLRLAGVVIAGGLLTLVEGLGQQRRLVAAVPTASEKHLLETVDQPTPSIPDFGPRGNVEVVKHADDRIAGASQPLIEAEVSPRKPEPPAALFLPSADQLSPLDTAYLDAFSILRQDNNCSRFYGGARVIQVLNDLKKQLKTSYMDTGIAVKMSGPTRSVTSLKYDFSYRLFEKAELNLRGSFYHGNMFRHDETVPSIGIFAPNTREARVTILLHELGHLVEKTHQAWLLPNDGGNELLSYQNTKRIISVCGAQIRQLSDTSVETELQAARPPLAGPAVQASIQP